jgi:hypothetical protein
MHNVNTGFSVLAKIKAERIDGAASFLAELNKDPGKNSKIPFDDFQTVHFTNIIIIPAQEYGKELLPATLLFATSFSGPLHTHLDELISMGGSALIELFQYCEDFPAGKTVSNEELKKYLLKHRRWDTFYSGFLHISKTEILREDKLRTLIQDFIDDSSRKGILKKNEPVEMRKQIQEHVSTQPDYDWTRNKKTKSLQGSIVLYWSLAVFSLVALFLLASVPGWLLFHSLFFTIPFFVLLAILVFAAVLVLSMRKYEKQEQFVTPRPLDKVVKTISNSQRFPVINTMCVSGSLKNGWLRPVIFQLALKAVVMVRGFLTIPTVYTARWIAIDKGKRLVFVSNFMNFTETYVRDFIDNRDSAKKINLLFGQGSGYPPTKWFLGGGALDDPNAFLYEVMANHHLTDFWYCPYHQLSIDNINMNRKILLGLNGNLSGDKLRDWLALL